LSNIFDYSLHDFYLRKESHAYNKGKALVVSKVPLPDYRADLDERHGSTQKEVECTYSISMSDYQFLVKVYLYTKFGFLQIKMSTDIERKVGNLLNSSQPTGTAAASLPSVSTDPGHKQSVTTTKSTSLQKTDTSKENLSVALKERQELLEVLKHLVEI
jgi:ATP-dependent RNA helicase DHX36